MESLNILLDTRNFGKFFNESADKIFFVREIFRGKKILSSESVAEMIKPHWIYNGNNGDTQDGAIKSYGLGVYNYDANLIGHTGEAFGLLSGLYFIPNSGAGFIFMLNGEATTGGNYLLEGKIIGAICQEIFAQRSQHAR